MLHPLAVFRLIYYSSWFIFKENYFLNYKTWIRAKYRTKEKTENIFYVDMNINVSVCMCFFFLFDVWRKILNWQIQYL